jgi:phosphinothricin acetyltransferase
MIRIATAEDAEGVLSIYAPVVRETAISFETEPPSPAAMRERIERTLEKYPWLVCEIDGAIPGYAYACRHRERKAYQWSAETALYVGEAWRRRGVGRALYAALMPLLNLQGLRNAYAGITLPNPASVALHEAMGFRPVGVYAFVGYKLGAWHDVGWWHLPIGEHGPAPAPPLPFARTREGDAVAAILARAAAGLV